MGTFILKKSAGFSFFIFPEKCGNTQERRGLCGAEPSKTRPLGTFISQKPNGLTTMYFLKLRFSPYHFSHSYANFLARLSKRKVIKSKLLRPRK